MTLPAGETTWSAPAWAVGAVRSRICSVTSPLSCKPWRSVTVARSTICMVVAPLPGTAGAVNTIWLLRAVAPARAMRSGISADTGVTCVHTNSPLSGKVWSLSWAVAAMRTVVPLVSVRKPCGTVITGGSTSLTTTATVWLYGRRFQVSARAMDGRNSASQLELVAAPEKRK